MKLGRTLALAISTLAVASCFARQDISDAGGLPVRATLHRADIRDALLALFKDRDSFVMDPRIHGTISGEFRKNSWADLLNDFARRLHATVKDEYGVFELIAIDSPKPARFAKRRADRSIVFSFHGAQLADAAQALFAVANDGHAASLRVTATGPVNLAGEYSTFDEAMRALVDSTHSTLCITNGAYLIVPSTALDVNSFDEAFSSWAKSDP